MQQVQRAPDGWLEIALHQGQRRALEARKRFVLVLAGWQSGKSVIGPPWLFNEIRTCGPGDYLIASPTYPLMMKKVLPEFLRLFERTFRLGRFVGQPKNCFTFSPDGCRRLFGHVPDVPTQVFFGHAGDPDSLESATYRAAWLDECGQAGFKLASWEAVLGRLSIHEGRVLLTTRPYTLGWLKQQLWDPWVAAGRNHPTIDVINFRSIDNPAFPRSEWERARASMPLWRFRLKYEGLFERPAGAIYDCFTRERHVCPAFAIPAHWPRWLGLDFGGTNTAGCFIAQEQAPQEGPPRPGRSSLLPVQSGKLYVYRAYGPVGSRTAKQHVDALLAGEPVRPTAVGGSSSEGQWRQEFAAGGLAVREPPIKDVEVGIQRVYGALARDELMVFDTCRGLIDDLESYSREVDDSGEATEKIAEKSSFHLGDSLRYVISHLRGGQLPPGSWRMERF